jgi:predicted ATP-binding protein involved in virulence
MSKQPDRKEHSKAIKSLEQSAKNDNLLSMFQLYLYNSTGKNVVKPDKELAQTYLDSVAEKLSTSKFVIKSVELYEFRRLRKVEIEFNEKLTIIIGNNGSGKTSIVDALAKTFTWFNNNLDKSTNGRPVTPMDVNVNSTDYGEVVTKIEFNKETQFETTLAKTIPGYLHSKSGEVTDIKLAGLMYRHLANHESISIPLLAYYSVERSDFKLTQTIPENASGDPSSNRFNSLNGALEGSGKLDDFSELYIELVNLAQGESASEVKALRVKINNIESLIKEAYDGKEIPKEDPIVSKFNSMKVELDDALAANCSTKHQRQLELVNHAIETIVPDVTGFEVDRASGKLKLMVCNFGNRVNISQLSQGQKTLVALTGDLARRLVVLNPEADNALNGHGIVIIDEVELHLHPKWQQEVLLGLQNTFPNIQFIVTTHSPQVLSTVDKTCIRQVYLNKHGEPDIKVPHFQTRGVTSASVLARIMEIESIPQNVPEAQLVKQFYKLLGNHNKNEAQQELEKIINHFSEDHPVTKECVESLNIYELKSKYLKAKE